jgi:hypothetical protein
MKTNLTTGLSALCAILLIVLLVLQAKQKTNLDTLRQEHQTFVTATEQRQQESHDAVAKLAGQVAMLGTNLESRFSLADQQQKEQRAERETNFREMRRQLDDLVNSGALFPDKTKPALEAVALAKAAEQAGDTNLAKIYYLSAVNHSPSEFSMLNDYAELVFRDSSATTEDFDRLKSVLQISLYQIPPANITNALSLLNETMRREEQLLAAQTPKPVPVNWEERFEQLTNSNALENSWTNLNQISSRWDGLNEIVESLQEEQPDSDLTERVERELELTQRVLAAARLTSAMDTIMAALDTSSEQPEKAVSLLQTAEATLGQLWGINSAGWPTTLQAKVDQYPKDIQSHVEIVAEVKSRPAVEKLTFALADAKNYKIGTASDKYQRALLYYDGCVSNATEAAQNISSAAGRKKADAVIKEIRDLAVDAKRKQFDIYQAWVVNVCKDAHEKFISWGNWGTGGYMGAFDATHLTSVDQGVLAPETAHLFNDVLQEFLAKMNGDGQYWKSKDLAEVRKKKLEDF